MEGTVINLLLLLVVALTPRSEEVFSPKSAVAFDCPSCSAAIPPRPATAPTGSEFLRQTAGLEPPERERAILAQLRSGNIPAFVRRLLRHLLGIAGIA